MQAFKCSGCGANIEINEDLDYGVCNYCGTKYFIPKINNTIVNNTTINYINPKDNDHITCIQPTTLGKRKNKYISLILCIFLGYIGAHKFYEGKIGMGILYIFTVGLFYIGWLTDIVLLIKKPTNYYV